MSKVTKWVSREPTTKPTSPDFQALLFLLYIGSDLYNIKQIKLTTVWIKKKNNLQEE